MERCSRADQVAFFIVLTAHHDEAQRTSRVLFDTTERSEVGRARAAQRPMSDIAWRHRCSLRPMHE